MQPYQPEWDLDKDLAACFDPLLEAFEGMTAEAVIKCFKDVDEQLTAKVKADIKAMTPEQFFAELEKAHPGCILRFGEANA